jgi:hypothetical protein
VQGAIVAGVADRDYRLIVKGELSDRLAVAFEGMTLTRAEGNTALTGQVRDQAELQALLQRVSDLGLTLLAATAIDDTTLSPDRSHPRRPPTHPTTT